MKIKIGFVLNAPIHYSETFLVKEFKLLQEAGFEICIFEGYHRNRPSHPYKNIKALPLALLRRQDIKHISIIFLRLLFYGLTSMFRLIYYERKAGTGIFRILKRIWMNAHILSAKVDRLHFCFAEVAIQKEWVAKSIGATMSVSLRGSDIIIYPKKNRSCYARLWGTVDKVHAVSHYILEQATQLGLSSEKEIMIIHDGVDVSSIPFNDADFHTPLRILSVGRLEPVKNYFFAIEIINKLLQEKISLHYILVGDGSLHQLLSDYINALGIANHITLLGKLTNEEVVRLMSESDLFLHTSLSEGLGVALLEAQAAGLIVLSLDAGGTSENIEDGRSGWILNKDINPSQGAQMVKQVLQLPVSVRLQTKHYARKRIRDRFDIFNNLSSWKHFFASKN